MTRDGDYDLSTPNTTWRKRSDFDNRIKLINQSNADLYLSIHMNYINDSKYSGLQVFYDNQESLATIIQDEYNKTFNKEKSIMKIPSNTYMYSKLDVKGVLIECGFMSNYTELNNLKDDKYQYKLARIITNSLVKYY